QQPDRRVVLAVVRDELREAADRLLAAAPVLVDPAAAQRQQAAVLVVVRDAVLPLADAQPRERDPAQDLLPGRRVARRLDDVVALLPDGDRVLRPARGEVGFAEIEAQREVPLEAGIRRREALHVLRERRELRLEIGDRPLAHERRRALPQLLELHPQRDRLGVGGQRTGERRLLERAARLVVARTCRLGRVLRRAVLAARDSTQDRDGRE